MELISLIKQLNEGISFSGKTLRKKANFSVAAAFNPNVRALDRAVSRLEKKIEHGADYFISQPVYSKGSETLPWNLFNYPIPTLRNDRSTHAIY
jgi:homocysteine S-methyltransferase